MVHDDKERMMRCPDCGMMEFPKICPAVIIAVTHGNKILMSKYAGREYKKYVLLAGFFCELDGEDGITLDTDELAMVEWFERDKMPVEAEDLSLTNEMMMAFKHGKV